MKLDAVIETQNKEETIDKDRFGAAYELLQVTVEKINSLNMTENKKIQKINSLMKSLQQKNTSC